MNPTSRRLRWRCWLSHIFKYFRIKSITSDEEQIIFWVTIIYVRDILSVVHTLPEGEGGNSSRLWAQRNWQRTPFWGGLKKSTLQSLQRICWSLTDNSARISRCYATSSDFDSHVTWVAKRHASNERSGIWGMEIRFSLSVLWGTHSSNVSIPREVSGCCFNTPLDHAVLSFLLMQTLNSPCLISGDQTEEDV